MLMFGSTLQKQLDQVVSCARSSKLSSVRYVTPGHIEPVSQHPLNQLTKLT